MLLISHSLEFDVKCLLSACCSTDHSLAFRFHYTALHPCQGDLGYGKPALMKSTVIYILKRYVIIIVVYITVVVIVIVIIHYSVHSDVRSSMYGPCSTLVYCLGYQACVFPVSVEFCLHDPIPGYRKWLYLNVACRRYVKSDALVASILSHPYGNTAVPQVGKNISVLEDGICFFDDFLDLYNTASVIRERIDKVTFIRANIKDSTRDEKRQKLVTADIEFIVSDKSEIFHRSCPAQDMARRLGYVYMYVLVAF